MGTLTDAVTQALDAGSPLAQAVEGFAAREGQRSMASAVAQAIEMGNVLVVEAGTGVGKTYAYLLPALLSGKRVLLSTATKALQDQLFGRDIPQLLSTLGLPSRVALLKGRSSYLCLSRLGLARQSGALQRSTDLRALASVELWAHNTSSGDLAELTTLDEQSPVTPLVTSTRESCVGAKCQQFQGCHVYRARREAMAADVVVINHHLFFADWNVRESGVAELLPTVNAVVFDEAHQLNEIGIQFLGTQLSTGQLQAWGRDLVTVGLQHARGLADWQDLAMRLEGVLAELHLVCQAPTEPKTRLRWSGEVPQGIAPMLWRRAMASLEAALSACVEALTGVAEAALELSAMLGRAELLGERLAHFAHLPPAGVVRWLECGVRLRMVESPLTVADALRERLTQRSDTGFGTGWIFTSATLGQDPGLASFVEAHGLVGATVLQVPSPFDYQQQARLYVPPDFAKPSDSRHSDQVAELVTQAAAILGGRTLVLTTTLRSMRRIAQVLRANFASHYAVQVLLQGETSKRELLAQFSAAKSAAGYVLVATGSFWEGVDVPGDALQMVVIDKIPFTPPDDPVVEARSQQLEAEGKSAFTHYQLPQAAMALRQGVGRLIRRETDRGVLVICDVRLLQMGYGRSLLSSLPNMPMLRERAEFSEALEALTKPSTKDLYSAFHP
ncbi:MAG: ATP-dependent DNA helicase [Curvibacter sp.]|nr:MAG: ATP-dependent DNA helicase [Curvibacter sp.]